MKHYVHTLNDSFATNADPINKLVGTRTTSQPAAIWHLVSGSASAIKTASNPVPSAPRPLMHLAPARNLRNLAG